MGFGFRGNVNHVGLTPFIEMGKRICHRKLRNYREKAGIIAL